MMCCHYCLSRQEVMLQMRPTPSPASVVKDDSTKSEVPVTPTSAGSMNQVSG